MKFRLSYILHSNPTEVLVEEFEDISVAFARANEMGADKHTYYNHGILAVFENEPTSGFDRMPYKGKASGKSYEPR